MRFIWLISLAFIVGCGGGSTEESSDGGPFDIPGSTDAQVADASFAEVSSPQYGATLAPEGVVLARGDGELVLVPQVLIRGEWQVPEQECLVEQGLLSCRVQSGTVTVSPAGAGLELDFAAEVATEVQGLALAGRGRLPGASAWMSQGFQSWSGSGVIALGGKVSDEELQEALTARGNDELLRTGRAFSWWYTWVQGSGQNLVAAALEGNRFRPWVQVWSYPDGDLGLRVASGAAGESISLKSGDKLHGETWFLAMDPDLAGMLRDYSAALPSWSRDHGRVPTMGWNSWYELWAQVDEDAVRANAELMQEMLQPLAGEEPLWVVVDDGWEERWGDWAPGEWFPSGMDGLAEDLIEQGFEVGIWMAPLLAREDSQVVLDHPDWFVEGLSYNHETGVMRVLDPTNPAAAKHLRDLIQEPVAWGYRLLKLDFLFTGTWEGPRYSPVTGMEAYQTALEIIREAAGDDVLILACGAPPLPSVGFADSWRVGTDIASPVTGPDWSYIANQARSLAARWPLCLATLCDTDPLLLRGLARPQVEAASWVAAMGGGAFYLSDDLRQLPEERRSWGLDQARIRTAQAGKPAEPLWSGEPVNSELATILMDYLSNQATHRVPGRWSLPDGGSLLFNAGDLEREIDGVMVEPRSALMVEP